MKKFKCQIILDVGSLNLLNLIYGKLFLYFEDFHLEKFLIF